jgi:hypothetical protein
VTAPSWWQLVLLGLAAFRVTRLIGWDDLTILPRRWLTGLSDDEHAVTAEHVDQMLGQDIDPWDDTQTPAHMPIGRARFYLSRMIRCPWCLGWWVSLAAWLSWEAWPHAVMVGAAPFAISAVVGLTAKNLDE